jgi:hypothetical protein
VPSREHLTGFSFLQEPLERPIAAAPQVGGVADPVGVHVETERRRRRKPRQPTRLAGDFDETHAQPAEFFRQRHVPVAGGAQLVEVFLEEAIVTVEDRRSIAASLQKGIGQD